MTSRTQVPGISHDAPRPVVKSDDASERAADRAAQAAVRGERMPNWSLAAQPVSVNRQPAAPTGSQEKTEEEKYEEAAKKTFEAVRETKPVKALEKKIMEHPTVKRVKDAATSPAGITTLVAAGVGGVSYLAATGKELPFQPPEIPLDFVAKGLSGKVTYKGPVNQPTYVGLTLTYKEQLPERKASGLTEKERFRVETARMAAEQEQFRAGLRYPPGSKEAEERRLADQAIARYIISQSGPLGVPGLTLPILPERSEPKKEDEPVRRSPATNTDSQPRTANVEDALRSPGRPLNDRSRRTMEARFGHDFSQVRIHDDSRAAASAADLQARAYTVGRDIVFGRGAPTTSSAEETHLLAHELAHVVQQSDPPALQERDEPALSSPSDATEREAEQLADRIASESVEPVSTHNLGLIDPKEDPGVLVASSRSSGPSLAPPGFSRAVGAVGPGESIPSGPRRTAERSFGRSLMSVRVHSGHQSDQLSRSIDATAFTLGSDIYLSREAPALTSRAGLHLLSHELTHVLQQGFRQPSEWMIHRSRALYMSTHGRQGYYQYAVRFHRDRNFPAPVEVSSIEEMLEHIVTLPRPIQSVRLVTHAVPAGIFLPLLRGGTTTLFERDLDIQGQTDLEGELAAEHATIRRRRGGHQVRIARHHVTPRRWSTSIYTQLTASAANRRFLSQQPFPATVTQGGDLEALIWWILDRETLSATEEVPDRRGRVRRRYLIRGIPNRRRAAAIASFDRNADIYRSRARDHLVARGVGRGNPAQRRAAADAAVTEFEQRLVAIAPTFLRANAAAGHQFNVEEVSPRYRSIQGALERGTFSNNLLFAMVAMADGMPFEIRGCRIGQNRTWLEGFRDFWGYGAGATAHKPDVSAPDLRHIYGIRGDQVVEWLNQPRRGRRPRRIYGGTAEFNQHIVHAR